MSDVRQSVTILETELVESIRIDVSAIPDHIRDALVAPLPALVEAYFKQPGVEERYQAWLKEENERERIQKRKERLSAQRKEQV